MRLLTPARLEEFGLPDKFTSVYTPVFMGSGDKPLAVKNFFFTTVEAAAAWFKNSPEPRYILDPIQASLELYDKAYNPATVDPDLIIARSILEKAPVWAKFVIRALVGHD